MDGCPACAGRGRLLDIPFLSSPWDEVAPGLWVGAHDIDSASSGFWDGRVVVRGEFDVVVSLFSREGHGPDPDVEHHSHRLPDGELDGDDAEQVQRLAVLVADRLADGKTVLVRCQAGLNRSSLVAALAMMRGGSTAGAAIAAIRAARSPNCLFNPSFTAFLHAARPPSR